LPQLGDVIGDKYKVEGMLGKGGMAVVLSARHQTTGKQVAVKWMLPKLLDRDGGVERFIRESQVAGLIQHPNVVDIYDVGQDGNSCYLVMELLRGKPLDFILEDGDATIDALLGYIIDAARGVHAAHGRRVLHRDLKPENIFVCDSPDGYGTASAKVLDFGISKLVQQAPDGVTRLTQTGAMLGTPYYMSPEQARGEKQLDLRSDVYAMGTVLFECCTGGIPFDGDTYNELIVKIATQPAPRATRYNPAVPEALDALIAKAMARKREDRHESMGALLEDLSRVRAALPDAFAKSIPVVPDASPRKSQDRPEGLQSGVTQRSSAPPAAGTTPGHQSPESTAPKSAVATLEFDLSKPPPRPAGADADDANGEDDEAVPDSGEWAGVSARPPSAIELAETQLTDPPAQSPHESDDQARDRTDPQAEQPKGSRVFAVIAVVVLCAVGAWLLMSPGGEAPAPMAAPTQPPVETVPSAVAPQPTAPAANPAPEAVKEPAVAPTVGRIDKVKPSEATTTVAEEPPPPPKAEATKTARSSNAAKAVKAKRIRTPVKPAKVGPSDDEALEAKGLSGTMRSDDF